MKAIPFVLISAALVLAGLCFAARITLAAILLSTGAMLWLVVKETR